MVTIDSVPVVRRVPETWSNLLGGEIYEKVIGLEDNIGIDHEEYKTILRDSAHNERAGGIAGDELEHLTPANETLHAYLSNEGCFLGRRPLDVIFCDETNDFRKVYDHGIRNGYGTKQDQETLRKHLETMSDSDEKPQRSQLALSGHARFVETDGIRATHNVHMLDPDWVIEQIRWTFDRAMGANGPADR